MIDNNNLKLSFSQIINQDTDWGTELFPDRDGVEDLQEKQQNSNPRIRNNNNDVDSTRQKYREQYSRILCQLHGWKSTPKSWSVFGSDLLRIEQEMGIEAKEVYGKSWDERVATQALKENFTGEEIFYFLSQSPFLKTSSHLSQQKKQNYALFVVEQVLAKKENKIQQQQASFSNIKKDGSANPDDDDFDLFSQKL